MEVIEQSWETVVSNPLTMLTDLAVKLFPHAKGVPLPQYSIRMGDAVFNTLLQASYSYIQFQEQCSAAVPSIFPDSQFAPLLAREDDRTPMLLTANGGIRVTPAVVLSDVLASAWLQMILFGLRNEETTYVRLVVDNYEELQKAMKGEKVREFNVTGVSGISLSEGLQVSTPWGTLRPAPNVTARTPFLVSHRPETTCTLVDERQVTVRVDTAADPETNFDATAERRDQNANLLFALSCLLGTEREAVSGGPIETWSTSFLPFSCSRGGSFPPSPPILPERVNIDEKVRSIETWAKIIASNHSEKMDFAASRLVAAIVGRTDARDSLVDAVMVWENLLGARSEVSFRLTTALAKLIRADADVEEQRAYRKQLKTVYNTRSDIVHGVQVDDAKANEHRDLAVSVAVKALREFYRRGEKWMAMSNSERVDVLLLGK